MNLLLKTSDFTLSISPLFKNPEGKHTIQFITKEENSKTVHETFALDYDSLDSFLSNFFQAVFAQRNNSSREYANFMNEYAPKVWQKLSPF